MVNSSFHISRHLKGMDTPSEKKLVLERNDLINRYVSVCNEALLENRDRFPFKQILGAAKKNEKNHSVEVWVRGGGAHSLYVFRLRDDGIVASSHDDCDGCACVRSWDVSAAYLEDVVRDPQTYIDNPAKLDWEWMYDVPAE